MQKSWVQALPSLHGTADPTHWPALQCSFSVQASPSVQVTPSASWTALHWPVAGSHLSAAQTPSATFGHTITLNGLAAHFGFSPDLSHICTPLHLSPSSFAAQSAWVSHSHTFWPRTHFPLTQKSAAVQLLPSTQPTPCVLSKLIWHLPLSLLHTFLRQAVSLTPGQKTALFGLGLHVFLPPEVSQYSVPLQRSPSSYLAQSASDWQAQTNVPGLQAPPPHTSPAVHASPSLHATLARVVPAGSSTRVHLVASSCQQAECNSSQTQ